MRAMCPSHHILPNYMLIHAVLYKVFNLKGKRVCFRALNAYGSCSRTALLVVKLDTRWKVNGGFQHRPLYPIE